MAAPTWPGHPSNGATDSGGAWSYSAAAQTAEPFMIFVALQDGTTAAAVGLSGATNYEALDGTDGTLTKVGAFAVGSPQTAILHVWVGRSLTDGTSTISGTNSTSEDLYMQAGYFIGVSAGTTLATVIENGTAGSTQATSGTGTTMSAPSIQSLGRDRLGIVISGADDDAWTVAMGDYTGGSGTITAAFGWGSATGTDGAEGLNYRAMPNATTDSGATLTISSAGWGAVGFALIGTTPPSLPFKPRLSHLIRR